MSDAKAAYEEFDFDLEILKITRRNSGAGTWVIGKINDEYRFDALVFPEHADNPEWEIGDSRISKLWIAKLSNKETTYNWDRGLDVPAASKKTQAVVEFLCDGLADAIYSDDEPAPEHRKGTDADLFEYCRDHLRAVAPVSVAGLEVWMQQQIPNVDETNATRVCREFLAEAKKQKLIEFCTDGCIDWKGN